MVIHYRLKRKVNSIGTKKFGSSSHNIQFNIRSQRDMLESKLQWKGHSIAHEIKLYRKLLLTGNRKTFVDDAALSFYITNNVWNNYKYDCIAFVDDIIKNRTSLIGTQRWHIHKINCLSARIAIVAMSFTNKWNKLNKLWTNKTQR